MTTVLPDKTRFVDSGWRVTIPKQMRDHLGWDRETTVCVSWDGRHIRIRHPLRCVACPDVTKVGALGKIVIPPRVRAETHIYRGQILRLSVTGDEIMMSPEAEQVRCQACGSEMDVRETLANVYLCQRCRVSLERKAERA
jgi:bifunctional DNA-binding transcriptional regulator/antitoxin component of YhaV-PrlF toxin-antitoxin module